MRQITSMLEGKMNENSVRKAAERKGATRKTAREEKTSLPLFDVCVGYFYALISLLSYSLLFIINSLSKEGEDDGKRETTCSENQYERDGRNR